MIKTFYNFKFQFAVSFLISIILYLSIVLPLLRLDIVKIITNPLNEQWLIVIVSAVYLILFFLWNPARSYWGKYRNSYNLDKPPFLLTDYIFLTAFFIILFYFISPIPISPVPTEFVSYFIILSASIILWTILSYLLLPDNTHPNRLNYKDNFSSDAPIRFPENDTLGRVDFVDNLYKEVVDLPFDDSFVFGLYGKWGEGKTSVLNLLRLKLDSNNNYITLNFLPWRLKNEDVIFNALYSQIEETVGARYLFPDFIRELRKYKKKISVGLTNVGMSLGLELGLQKDSVELLRSNIERGICELGKKIIIIIDDIDRLQSKEMLLIFQAVKSHMMFKNLIFILSMDNAKVAKKLINHGGRDYLSKIVQKPIRLPPPYLEAYTKSLFESDHAVPRESIKDIQVLSDDSTVSVEGFFQEKSGRGLWVTSDKEGMKNRIKILTFDNKVSKKYVLGERLFISGQVKHGKILIKAPEGTIKKFRLSEIDTLFYVLLIQGKISANDIDEFDKEISLFFRTHLLKRIKTLRDIKTFINSLLSSLPPIAKEVKLKDFVLLEFLKVFYPDVYDDIYDYWWVYVKERSEDDYFYNPLRMSLSTDKKADQQQSIDHLDNLLKDIPSESDRMICRETINNLFPKFSHFNNENNDRKSKSISSQSFSKYFTLKVPPSELPDEYINGEINKWKISPKESVINKTIFQVQKIGKLKELFIKLHRDYLSEFSEELSILIIRSIYKNANSLSRVGTQDFWNSEYDKAVALTFRLLEENVSKDKIQAFVEEIITKTEDFAFATHAVLFSTHEGGGSLFNVYDSVQIEKLRDLATAKFRKHYIDHKHDIFREQKINKEWIFILYQWGSNFSTFIGTNNTIVNDYVLERLKNNPKTFYTYINAWRSGGFRDDKSIDVDKFRKIYDANKFVSLADKFIHDSNLKSDEKKVLKMFVDAVNKINDKIEVKQN